MITGKKSVLRPPIDSDLPSLVELRNDLDLQFQLMAFPKANSLQKTVEWLNRNLNDEQTIFFIIADKADNQTAGFIQLKNISFVSGTGELGICLNQQAQGRGVAEEAMKMLEKYSRNVFNLRKIMLQVLQSNERAISFYEKYGYENIGTLKKHHYQNTEFHDVVIMEKFID